MLETKTLKKYGENICTPYHRCKLQTVHTLRIQVHQALQTFGQLVWQ
jgi:hypothetical protein